MTKIPAVCFAKKTDIGYSLMSLRLLSPIPVLELPATCPDTGERVIENAEAHDYCLNTQTKTLDMTEAVVDAVMVPLTRLAGMYDDAANSANANPDCPESRMNVINAARALIAVNNIIHDSCCRVLQAHENTIPQIVNNVARDVRVFAGEKPMKLEDLFASLIGGRGFRGLPVPHGEVVSVEIIELSGQEAAR